MMYENVMDVLKPTQEQIDRIAEIANESELEVGEDDFFEDAIMENIDEEIEDEMVSDADADEEIMVDEEAEKEDAEMVLSDKDDVLFEE